MPPSATDVSFLDDLERDFERSTVDFARAYYLFATAKLSETYNSQEIYARYPQLTDEATFRRAKALYDAQPDDERTKRLFLATLGFYIGHQLSALSDAYENLKNTLAIDVTELGLCREDGTPLTSLLYEDVSEWLKKIDAADTRRTLYDRMSAAHQQTLAPRFIELFHAENRLLADLGYGDLIAFYSQTSGHRLAALGALGARLVRETDDLYTPRIAALYQARTGMAFSQAVRADISYVFHGKSAETTAIDVQFPEARLTPLAIQTLDGLGLDFSSVSRIVDFTDRAQYDADVVQRPDPAPGTRPDGVILLDVAKRAGKRSRAYVYPARVGREIYLSVKPEGGLDDYSAFFHESGHALHFAYVSPTIGYALATLGNNTVTETYAYTLQNLFLNRHWLHHAAGLSQAQALAVVRRQALNDLYMLRRYSSKIQFELALFAGDATHDLPLAGRDAIYAELLTRGTGFRYEPEGWTRDVDAGFYVADYFTAWTLEAQLRDTLCTRFGTPDTRGEDWYQNPQAGAFLQSLWHQGSPTPTWLAAQLGYADPNDITPLVRWMRINLAE